MQPLIAIHAIGRLKRKKEKYVPIAYEDFKETGLTPVHQTKNQEGKPIFFFVDRLEYIKYLESKHQLFKKRQSLRNVLRNSLRE